MHVHEDSLQSVECNVAMEHWNGILEWNTAMTNLKLVVIKYLDFKIGTKRILKKQLSLCCEI